MADILLRNYSYLSMNFFFLLCDFNFENKISLTTYNVFGHVYFYSNHICEMEGWKSETNTIRTVFISF
jgi:hypothetical protein